LATTNEARDPDRLIVRMPTPPNRARHGESGIGGEQILMSSSLNGKNARLATGSDDPRKPNVVTYVLQVQQIEAVPFEIQFVLVGRVRSIQIDPCNELVALSEVSSGKTFEVGNWDDHAARGSWRRNI